jgi:elongation factor Ts
MSDNFIKLSDEICETIIKNNVSTLEQALTTKASSNETIEGLCTELTARIGEKIAIRRFQLITKNDNEVFESYVHSNRKIAVLLVMSQGSNTTVGHDVAMHAAAMNPKFLSSKDVDQN